jgi:hypothetical protein
MEIKIKARQDGAQHELALELKASLEKWGEVGVACMTDPRDVLNRLEQLGVNAIAEPKYRWMPPLIKRNQFGEPVDMIYGEKVKTGYVFKLIK